MQARQFEQFLQRPCACSARAAINASAGERRRGALHIQKVNARHSRMRTWLLPFRGIASR